MWLADAPRLRRVVLAYSLSELGGWFAMVALPLAVYGHTHSSLAVGGLLAAGALPAVLAPAIVARVEMMQRRGGIALLFVIAGAAAALLALLLVRFWLPGIFPIFALQNGVTFAGVAMLRAEGALHHPDKRLDHTPADMQTMHRANAAFNLAMSVAMVVGPALAGLSVTELGPAPALLIASGGLIAASVPIRRLLARHSAASVTSVRARLADAATHIRNSPQVGPLLRAEALALLFFTAVVPIAVAYSKTTLDAGDAGYPVLMGVWGAGMIVGGLLFARQRHPPSDSSSPAQAPTRLKTMLLLGTAAVAVAYIGYAAAPSLALASLAAVLGGVGNGIQWAAFLGIVQILTPADLMARTMGATEALRATTPFVGILLGGALATAYTTRLSFFIAGIGTLLALAWLTTLLLPLRIRSHLPRSPVAAAAAPAANTDPPSSLSSASSPPIEESARATGPRLPRASLPRRRELLYFLSSSMLLLLALAATIITARSSEWHPLGLIAVLALIVFAGEFTRAFVKSNVFSGGFLSVTLAACILGPSPAVLLGLLGSFPATPARRRAARYWLANITDATVVGLTVGLAVRLLVHVVYHDANHLPRLLHSFRYIPTVVGAALVVEILNATLVSWAAYAFWGTSIKERLRELLAPLLPAQAAFGLIAGLIVLGYARFGMIAWVVALPVLIGYQQLSMRLVTSGAHLETLARAMRSRAHHVHRASGSSNGTSSPAGSAPRPTPTGTGHGARRQSARAGSKAPRIAFYALTACLALASFGIAALTSRSYDWTPVSLLALLAGLAFFGEHLLIKIHGQALSASFVAVTLAMVLLGPAPAIAIAVATMVYTSARRRLAPRFWLANVTIPALFLLAGGMLARALAGNLHAPGTAHLNQGITFAEIVFLVFMVSMTLNFLLVAINSKVLWHRRISDQFRHLFVPVLPAQLALGALTTAAAVAYMNFGVSVLLGGVVLLALFQYLMTRLVRSEDRLAQLIQEALQRTAMEIGALAFTMRSLEARAPDCGRHAAAVARYAEELTRYLGQSPDDQHIAHAAGLFHDIGMISLPDRIFDSNTVLDEDDWQSIRNHPIEGSTFVSQFPDYHAAADAILSHHERWDGNGYPDGLIGTEIPLLSRVLAICEAYDKIATASSYAPAGDPEHAASELQANAGSQFDPELVEAFIEVMRTSAMRQSADMSLAAELDAERRHLVHTASPRDVKRSKQAQPPVGSGDTGSPPKKRLSTAPSTKRVSA